MCGESGGVVFVTIIVILRNRALNTIQDGIAPRTTYCGLVPCVRGKEFNASGLSIRYYCTFAFFDTTGAP